MAKTKIKNIKFTDRMAGYLAIIALAAGSLGFIKEQADANNTPVVYAIGILLVGYCLQGIFRLIKK